MHVESSVVVASGAAALEGTLALPRKPRGVVLFAHGSGSSRHSPRNAFVARSLHAAGFASLLIDLLTTDEDADYERRFDIALLTRRLADAARFLARDDRSAALPLGLFGASTGAAAALRLAAAEPDRIRAVVSRGGRPDLAGPEVLARVQAPTLLIVGGADSEVLRLNEAALAALRAAKELAVVPGATHLFEEPGALAAVARLAAAWFERQLGGPLGAGRG